MAETRDVLKTGNKQGGLAVAVKKEADSLLMRLAGKPKMSEGAKKKSETTDKKSHKTKGKKGTNNTKTVLKENGHATHDEEMDDEELASFRELFNMLDQSHSGGITPENLFEEMRRVDNDITFEEIEDVFKKVDKDGSGTIDFDEFLHYITHMGEDLQAEEKRNRVKKRKRIFCSAITQFSLKQTLADLERTLRKGKTPHVISHYSAGARLQGLTTRQLNKQMKRMQKTASKNDSPYAKPLMFVHMGTTKILKQKPQSPVFASSSESDDDISTPEGISKQIKNQMKLVAQRGSIAADANKIIEWRRSVSAQLRRGSILRGEPVEIEKIERLTLPSLPEEAPVTKSKGKKGRTRVTHSFVTVKSASNKPAVSAVKRTRYHMGWVTPRIMYNDVPLPSLKMKYEQHHNPTFNDLPIIRAKAKNATHSYYDQLRRTEINNAKKHWERLYAGFIRPKKLLNIFKKVYDAYSPQRLEESFVVCPWGPGPFLVVRHNKNGTQSLHVFKGYSSQPQSPEPFKHKNNYVVRPLTPLV